MASHGTAIALPTRRPAAPRRSTGFAPRPTTGIGRHRRAVMPETGQVHAPVDLDTMLVWFVVLLALGLVGVVLSALA